MSSFQTPVEESSINLSEPIQPPIEEPSNPDQENPDINSNLEPEEKHEQQQEEEEEEEGECGFCLFMKAGECKESFVSWEKCIEDAEKNKEDIVANCFQITSVLKQCMEAHSDYYGPVLRAEKAAEAEAVEQLEKEKEKEADEGVQELDKEKEADEGVQELDKEKEADEGVQELDKEKEPENGKEVNF